MKLCITMNITQEQYIEVANQYWNEFWAIPVIIPLLTYVSILLWTRWSNLSTHPVAQISVSPKRLTIGSWSDLCIMYDMFYNILVGEFIVLTIIGQVLLSIYGFGNAGMRCLSLIPPISITVIRELAMRTSKTDRYWIYNEKDAQRLSRYLDRHLRLVLISMAASSLIGWWYDYAPPLFMRIVTYIPVIVASNV